MDEKRLFDYLNSNSSFNTDPFPTDSFVLMKSQNTFDDRTLYQELARFKLSPPVNKLRLLKD
jgi:2'-5' RNA ligase